MKTLYAFLVLSLFTFSFVHSQDFDIQKSYDKFSKETTISLDERLKINTTTGTTLTYAFVSVHYKKNDTTYVFLITGVRGDMSYANKEDKSLLLIDDNLSEIKVYDVNNEYSSNNTYLAWYYILPKEDLLKIASGKKVDIQIKNRDFVLEGSFKPDDLKIMKAFLKKY